MNKTELLEVFEKQPIVTEWTTIRLMMEAEHDMFLEHNLESMSVKGTLIEELFIKQCKDLFSADDEILFSIHDNNNDSYIGYFELKGLDADPEIGMDLIRDYQRQGLGFEVTRAVVDFIFANTDISVLKYNCFRYNEASLHLGKKLGAVQIKEKALFETLQDMGISQSTRDKASDFDIIVHEIRKRTWR